MSLIFDTYIIKSIRRLNLDPVFNSWNKSCILDLVSITTYRWSMRAFLMISFNLINWKRHDMAHLHKLTFDLQAFVDINTLELDKLLEITFWPLIKEKKKMLLIIFSSVIKPQEKRNSVIYSFILWKKKNYKGDIEPYVSTYVLIYLYMDII